MLTSKQLGDHGEDFAISLLRSRGYTAEKLTINAPTYDIRASNGHTTFFVSVKVSRTKQHVRLGTRRSAEGLTPNNFVFAFTPSGDEIESLETSPYELLILPADVVRTDSLTIHDNYWLSRSKDPNIFSVIVKAYDKYGKPTWQRWQHYKEAWGILPPPAA